MNNNIVLTKALTYEKLVFTSAADVKALFGAGVIVDSYISGGCECKIEVKGMHCCLIIHIIIM